VYLSSAPDGTLYVVDMYRGIIEHRISITMYLRDQILARKLEQPTGFGRIYRVVHDTSRRDTTRHLRDTTTARLVETLSHPNGWWRDTAQRLLVERRAASAAPALMKLAEHAPDARTRLRALWTLDGLDSLDARSVTRALQDVSRDVRSAGVRLAERWLGQTNHAVTSAVVKLIDDPDASVRRQLAASLGAMAIKARDAALVALLERHADDPITLDAALSGAAGVEAVLLDRLMPAGAIQTPQRDAAITMLTATIIRSGQDDRVQPVLARIADVTRASWQRSAVLAGVEVALLGSAMPGTPAARQGAPPSAAVVPCPTCPGGRAGPGGAYAFPRPAAITASATGSAGGTELRLTREPATLSGLAAGGELAQRIGRVLARMTWPGKSGAVTVAPLTVDEQRRFDAGREIYRNVCQACHQADGRGQDKIAPSLRGSAVALASAEIPARVLLNGKEGPIGLMPPIGSAFGDEQVASVLTYIRREWDQQGTPVDAAAIRAVRAVTVDRTRPWTDAELMKLPAWGR
jgi:mono/diheme cytochrome c family protein